MAETSRCEGAVVSAARSGGVSRETSAANNCKGNRANDRTQCDVMNFFRLYLIQIHFSRVQIEVAVVVLQTCIRLWRHAATVYMLRRLGVASLLPCEFTRAARNSQESPQTCADSSRIIHCACPAVFPANKQINLGVPLEKSSNILIRGRNSKFQKF
jgi:hypothetical protein